MSESKGYWATHHFTKHSVQEVEEFVGWNQILKICEAGENQRNQALPAALFSTGCRVSEALQLRRSHFDLSDAQWVKCIDVPMVKQKTSKPFRTFSFLRDEPTWPYVERYLSHLDADDRLFEFGRNRALLLVYELGHNSGTWPIWAHWFRSQRASQMGAEYQLTENDLMEWFKVKDRNWARRYCKKGDWGLRQVLEANKPKEWRA